MDDQPKNHPLIFSHFELHMYAYITLYICIMHYSHYTKPPAIIA